VNPSLCVKNGVSHSLKEFVESQRHILRLMPPLWIATALLAGSWEIALLLIGYELFLQVRHEQTVPHPYSPLLYGAGIALPIGFLAIVAGGALLTILPALFWRGNWEKGIILIIAAVIGASIYSASFHARRHSLRRMESWGWTTLGITIAASGALTFRL
jgi:uncharacterized membrane protein